MQTKTKRDRTNDLVEVQMDNTGRLANKLIGIRSEIFNLEREEKKLADDLAVALKEQGRLKISVQGFAIKVKSVEASSSLVIKREKA